MLRRSTTYFSRVLIALLIVFQVLPYIQVSAEESPHFSYKNQTSISKVDPELATEFSNSEEVTFLIKLKEQADVKAAANKATANLRKNTSVNERKRVQNSAVVSALRTTAFETQGNLLSILEEAKKTGKVSDFQSFYIVNAVAVTATEEMMQEIAALPEVEKVLPNRTRELYVQTELTQEFAELQNEMHQWNIERLGANQVWEQYGIDGSGVVVATIDSGVQWDHPALKEHYRGVNADGSVSHELNWFDATADEEEPYDTIGHGTHVTGTIVGSEPDGENQIGVAPGAKWIAARAFTAFGGTDVDLLEAGEWMLAPKDAAGVPHPEAAPDIINNSWGSGPGLDEWYRPMVQAWTEAGIIPVFAAGNDGPEPGTIASPANYPEVIAVASITRQNKLANSSSRGPTAYLGEVKPNISAPGVSIRSSVPGSGYSSSYSGTSMATPHVSGLIAMLLEVNSSLKMDEIKGILRDTAIPLTDETYTDSPNDGFGYGLVDAFGAVSSITSGVGEVTGRVFDQGDGVDEEVPSIDVHEVTEAFEHVAASFTATVSDDVSVDRVYFTYQVDDGEPVTVEATLAEGNFQEGTYRAVIPEAEVVGNTIDYFWSAVDFGENETESVHYQATIQGPVTVGYFEDFEEEPANWFTFGENNSWQWGAPTVGLEAYSGENLYGTNLGGLYDSNANMTLVSPPVRVPDEGSTYLQFASWYMLETYYDFGHVVVSTDLENWEQIARYNGNANYWNMEEIDLAAYRGQTIYIGFNVISDDGLDRAGWYIDDLTISDESIGAISEGEMGVDSIELPEIPEGVSLKNLAGEQNEPFLSPLDATMTVLETNRSVKTNPATGVYRLLHGAGTYTIQADAYGFYPVEQSVEILEDGVITENFMLDPIPVGELSGVVSHEQTGEPIEGARVFVVEDAAVAPVRTDADGNYQLELFEGEYTLKVLAEGFFSKDITIEVTGNDVTTVDAEMWPFYGYDGEIGYDDGSAEDAMAFVEPGNGWAVRMSLPEEQDIAYVTGALFHFWNEEFPHPGGTDFQVAIYDTTGADKAPGKMIAGPIDATAVRNDDWTYVDLSGEGVLVEDDFYIVYIQPQGGYDSPGLSTDHDEFTGRSWQMLNGDFTPTPREEGNYMIRAVVDYLADDATIVSPADGTYTSESNVVVEGLASPNMDIKIYNDINSGFDELATVKSDELGKFSVEVELTEGLNKLQLAYYNEFGSSETSGLTHVVLDQLAPELELTTPEEGFVSGSRIVSVTGVASDEYLEKVVVGGQEVTVGDDGKLSSEILLTEGENTVAVIAIDRAGNVSTIERQVVVDSEGPAIENLKPDVDQTVFPGDVVEISFESEAVGGEAGFVVQFPGQNALQSFGGNRMEEVEPGFYYGEWTVPSGVNLDGVGMIVSLADQVGNETMMEAPGKISISSERVDRIAGDIRYDTAVEISREGWNTADTVILARGLEFADALAGVPLASKLDAPILLTPSDELWDDMLAEIERLGSSEVVVLGGEAAISSEVVAQLEAAGLNVRRIAGKNRFETAAMIAAEVAPEGSGEVVVANGMDFPDALSVASYAAKAGMPILLSTAGELPTETAAAVAKLGAEESLVVGGTSVISNEVLAELPSAERVSGKDRYGTNVALANYFGFDAAHVFISTGKNYADALTGAVLAAKKDSAIMLVHHSVPGAVAEYLSSAEVERLTVFGGESAVGHDVVGELRGIIE